MLSTLILLRHGEAEKAAPSGRDTDRELTEKGRADAKAAGAALAERGLSPDVALVSTAIRAQETWEHAALSLADVEVELDAGLYNASDDRILAAAEGAEAESVIVVAHNPGMAELVDALARISADSAAARRFADVGFPPGAVAVFSRTDENAPLRLRTLIAPDEAA
jgi:phosphohistidine phosphatase